MNKMWKQLSICEPKLCKILSRKLLGAKKRPCRRYPWGWISEYYSLLTVQQWPGNSQGFLKEGEFAYRATESHGPFPRALCSGQPGSAPTGHCVASVPEGAGGPWGGERRESRANFTYCKDKDIFSPTLSAHLLFSFRELVVQRFGLSLSFCLVQYLSFYSLGVVRSLTLAHPSFQSLTETIIQRNQYLCCVRELNWSIKHLWSGLSLIQTADLK